MITKRRFIFGSALGAVTVVFASSGRSRAQASPTPQQVYFDPGNPVLGNPKGDVTIAEFFDFQCPYCKRDFPNVRNVVEKDGNVRLVMKDWPIFGETSVYASQLALGAAALDTYELALSALMNTRAKLSRPDVDAALDAAGLDVSALRTAYETNKRRIEQTLARNAAQADAFGFPGTPAYAIGRSIYGGVLDKKALEGAIADARKAS